MPFETDIARPPSGPVISAWSATSSFGGIFSGPKSIYPPRPKPDIARPYKVPIVVPIVVLTTSVFLVLAPIIDNPKIEYVYSIIFMAFGGLLYIPFVTYKMKLPGLGKFTQILQLIMKIVPPTGMPDC